IFSVNPAKNGVNTVLTDAKFNWLTHRDSQRGDLFHPIEFRLFRIILRNVGNTQKIPCTRLISNTVLFVTRPAFIYRFFRYVFHLFISSFLKDFLQSLLSFTALYASLHIDPMSYESV